MPAKRAQQSAGNPLINNERLKQLYVSMMQCRMLGERSRPAKRAKNSAPMAVSVGHEATVAAVVSNLLPEDVLSPAAGDLVTCFLKGATLHSIFRLLSDANAMDASALTGEPCETLNLIPLAPDALTRLGIATGTALAHKMQNDARVVAAFFGKESGPIQSWQQTLHFATNHRLPIVYVLQRELGASDFDDHREVPVAGLPVIPVDGHDAVAVYRVAQESILRARQGSGPTLITALGHYGASGRKAFATPSTEPEDPIRKMEAYLVRKGLFNETWKRHVADKFSRELEAAARNTVYPTTSKRGISAKR